MLSQAQVGPVAPSIGDGIQSALRSGRQGDQIVSELHGRFYEQAYRGNLFKAGTVAITALSANTITTATSATGTPIIGVWNPVGSGKNLILLQATLQAFANTLTTPVGPGAFIWLTSLNNSAISTGSVPFNMSTLAQSGSVAKAFMGGVALTGLTNVMVTTFASDFGNATALTHGTITATSATLSSVGGVQNFDGSVLVPPGAVIGLYNTTSTTTFSAVGAILWEEVPI